MLIHIFPYYSEEKLVFEIAFKVYTLGPLLCLCSASYSVPVAFCSNYTVFLLCLKTRHASASETCVSHPFFFFSVSRLHAQPNVGLKLTIVRSRPSQDRIGHSPTEPLRHASHPFSYPCLICSSSMHSYGLLLCILNTHTP